MYYYNSFSILLILFLLSQQLAEKQRIRKETAAAEGAALKSAKLVNVSIDEESVMKTAPDKNLVQVPPDRTETAAVALTKATEDARKKIALQDALRKAEEEADAIDSKELLADAAAKEKKDKDAKEKKEKDAYESGLLLAAHDEEKAKALVAKLAVEKLAEQEAATAAAFICVS